MGEMIVFLGFALLAVASAIGVISVRNPVYSALLLVINFFCLAAFYVLLSAQFLAVVQVIVYAGAIMVLFVFVVMFLSPGREEDRTGRLREQRLLAVPLVLLLLSLVMFVITASGIGPVPASAAFGDGGSVEAVGRLIFSDYVFPFEVTSLLLLVAIVGVVVMAKRRA